MIITHFNLMLNLGLQWVFMHTKKMEIKSKIFGMQKRIKYFYAKVSQCIYLCKHTTPICKVHSGI